jgi:hypothetical protein
MKVYIDQGINQRAVKKMAKQYGFKVIQGHRTENRISGATQISEPFTIGASLIGGIDRIADDNITDVSRVIGRGNRADISHVYPAYMEEGCDYFVTNNPRDFIRNGKKDKNGTKRTKLEELMPGLKIMTLDEFQSELKRPHSDVE